MSLVKFYENPDSLAASRTLTDDYRMITKPSLSKLFKSIHKRLFDQDTDVAATEAVSGEETRAAPVDSTDEPLSKQLADFLS